MGKKVEERKGKIIQGKTVILGEFYILGKWVCVIWFL